MRLFPQLARRQYASGKRKVTLFNSDMDMQFPKALSTELAQSRQRSLLDTSPESVQDTCELLERALASFEEVLSPFLPRAPSSSLFVICLPPSFLCVRSLFLPLRGPSRLIPGKMHRAVRNCTHR